MLLGLTFQGRTWVERQYTDMRGRAGVAVGTEPCGEMEARHAGVNFEPEPGGERVW